MKSILALAAVAALASPASTQIFSEDFSSGTPPTGWTVVDVAASGVAGWIPGILDPYSGMDHTDWAFHDYDYVLPANTIMVSPVIDFSTVSGASLSFLTETEWAHAKSPGIHLLESDREQTVGPSWGRGPITPPGA